MEGMRGLSAFLVFFVHFNALFGARAGHSPVHSILEFMATLGHCGVDVFFVLSGFIIYGLLQRRPTGYIAYIGRRLVRLYPVFTAIFAVYVVLSLVMPSYSKLPGSLFPALVYLGANFLMLPGIFPIVPLITPAWSLSYELCFYLTLPLLLRSLRLLEWPRAARVGFFLLICGACLGLSRAGLFQHPRLIMFGAGILLCETLHLRPSWIKFGDLAALLLFACTLALIGARNEPVFASYCGPIIVNSDFNLMLLFVSTYALGYYALGGGDLLAKLFSWDWLRWFGNMSYSYYLAHGLIMHLLRGILEYFHLPALLSLFPFLLLGLLTFATTVVGSAVVFLAIEKRFSFSHRPARVSVPAAQETSVSIA